MSAPIPDWTSPCGTVQLYCADCRDILPHLGKVDAVVTDPPYGIGAGKQSFGMWRTSRMPEEEWDNVPADVSSIIHLGRYHIIWGGNYFTLPPSRRFLVWNKGAGFAGRDFAECEMAWCSYDGNARLLTHDPLASGDYRNKEHPTQKPLPLMEWCIEQLPSECRSILDPFMGSGTTGVAAVKAGKSFIGIERERHYFESAKRRIMDALGMEVVKKDGLKQRRMFAPAGEQQ